MMKLKAKNLYRSLAGAALLASLPASAMVFPGILYFGKTAHEAVMTFDAELEFKASPDTAIAELARPKIEAQVKFLIGSMASEITPGAPRTDHEISNIRIRRKSDVHWWSLSRLPTFVASYSYRGTVLVPNSASHEFPVYLPTTTNPPYSSKCINDPTENSQSFFWYSWNPESAHCPLKRGVDYQKIIAHLEPLPNTVTYPDYERLADPQTGKIRIDVVFGRFALTERLSPYDSSDAAAEAYREISGGLKKLGYASSGIQSDPRDESAAFVEEFTKQDKRAASLVRMVFPRSRRTFFDPSLYRHAKDAMEHASVMIYNGHSDLGGGFDINAIERNTGSTLQLPPDRYQILFFNGCASYEYYNSQYLELKPRKNLNILTNGLPSAPNHMYAKTLALIGAIDAWANDQGTMSYPEILDKIIPNELTGVNGDEENPRPGAEAGAEGRKETSPEAKDSEESGSLP